MPVNFALRRVGIDRRALFPACIRKRKHAQLSARMLAAALSAAALAGCDRTWRGASVTRTANADISGRPASRTPIPLPDRTLLNPQPEPDCKFTAGDSDADRRQKLDYERQCYRHAEMIVRSRLRLLQGSVGETIKAVKRSEWSGS
jgi:hypothetical protein